VTQLSCIYKLFTVYTHMQRGYTGSFSTYIEKGLGLDRLTAYFQHNIVRSIA